MVLGSAIYRNLVRKHHMVVEFHLEIFGINRAIFGL